MFDRLRKLLAGDQNVELQGETSRDEHGRYGARGNLTEIIAKKKAIYQRDWRRDDGDWVPCSAGWPSENDTSGEILRFSVPHLEGGVLDVTEKGLRSGTVFLIEHGDAAPKITDRLLDWGSGFVWPSTKQPSTP